MFIISINADEAIGKHNYNYISSSIGLTSCSDLPHNASLINSTMPVQHKITPTWERSVDQQNNHFNKDNKSLSVCSLHLLTHPKAPTMMGMKGGKSSFL